MEVSQEYLRHISRVERHRGHSSRQATATVEQELLRSSQNQRTDAISLRIEGRPRSRSQQNYPQIGVAIRCGQPLRLYSGPQQNQQQKAQTHRSGLHLPLKRSIRFGEFPTLLRHSSTAEAGADIRTNQKSLGHSELK